MTVLDTIRSHAETAGWHTEQRPNGICGGAYLYLGHGQLGIHTYFTADGDLIGGNIYRLTGAPTYTVTHIGEARHVDVITGWVDVLTGYPTQAAVAS